MKKTLQWPWPLVGAPSYKPKGHRLDYKPGYMPCLQFAGCRLQVCPGRGMYEKQPTDLSLTSMCLSLSPSLPLKKRRKKKRKHHNCTPGPDFNEYINLDSSSIKMLRGKAQWGSVSLDQRFSMRGNFAPRGTLAKSGDIFSCHKGQGKGGGATDIHWVEKRMPFSILQHTGQSPQQRSLNPKCQ